MKMPYIRENEERNFRIGFEFTDVKYCKIQIVDEVDKEVTEDQFSTSEIRFAKLLLTIIFLSFFG